MTSHRPVSAVERPFAIGELFFSATDRKGFIRSANQVFATVAGYEPEEFLGAAHNLVRHPDMPRIVFRLLWETLGRGEPICAYVKNRAKDGSYYWVLAIAFPAGDEYVSVRLKPTSALFDAVRSLYDELRETEAEVEPDAGRTAAMDAAADLLLRRLRALGFDSYEDFMWRATAAEVSARRSVVGDAPARRGSGAVGGGMFADAWATCWATSGRLGHLADQLDEYEELAVRLGTATRSFDELADDVGLFALNAGLTAGRANGRTRVLETIADLMRRGSKEVEADVGDLRQVLQQTVRDVRRLAFSVAAAAIELEMTCAFLDEHDPDEGHDGARAAINTIGLLTSIERDLAVVRERLRALPTSLDRLQSPLRRLSVHLGGLRILRLRAEVDAAGEASAEQFTEIIEQVESHLAAGTDRANELRVLVSGARDHAVATDWRAIAADLDALVDVRHRLAAPVLALP